MPKKIKLNGPVIGDDRSWLYDWLGMSYIGASKLSAELEDARGDEVELYINSGGGSVFAGSEVYTILKEYSGKVTAKITGVAASAASFLAMGADEIKMSPTSQMMIHNAATWTDGDKNDHSSNTNMLSGTDVAITNAYRLKTGRETNELLDLMNKTTWMNAQQAVELGFADGILFDEENALMSVSNSLSGEIPTQVVDKLRDMLLNTAIKGQANVGAGGGIPNIIEGIDLTAILMQDGMVNGLAAPGITQQQNKEEPKTMDMNELKEKHPELVAQLTSDAQAAERTRVAAITSLAEKTPKSAELVKAAIANGETAGELAIKMVKASQVRIANAGKDRALDAEESGVDAVASLEAKPTGAAKEEEVDAAVDSMVEMAKNTRLNNGGRR